MPQTSPAKMRFTASIVAATAAWQFGTAASAWAQQPLAPPPVAVEAPAPEAPASTAMASPSMTGPLVANPNPWNFDSAAGKLYVTGVLSGLGMEQTNPVFPDKTSGRFDLTNGQVMLQKTDGIFQFYVQAGGYSLPALGSPYISVQRGTGDFFGGLPVGYAKFAPADEFSFLIGKLPTVIGAEYTFTFQNMNIQRGLLWNQEPAISRGFQANYTLGPVAFALSLNDGFYSNRYDWLSGSVAWTIDKVNTLTFAAGGNTQTTFKSSLATPIAQNNSEIFNLIYTYNNAPWTITPYFQYTHVPQSDLHLQQCALDDHAVLPIHPCSIQCIARIYPGRHNDWRRDPGQLCGERQCQCRRQGRIHQLHRKRRERCAEPALWARQHRLVADPYADLSGGHFLPARGGVVCAGQQHHSRFRVRPKRRCPQPGAGDA
jgi:hypothetical protein